jgi:hypothetical protein
VYDRKLARLHNQQKSPKCKRSLIGFLALALVLVCFFAFYDETQTTFHLRHGGLSIPSSATDETIPDVPREQEHVTVQGYREAVSVAATGNADLVADSVQVVAKKEAALAVERQESSRIAALERKIEGAEQAGLLLPRIAHLEELLRKEEAKPVRVMESNVLELVEPARAAKPKHVIRAKPMPKAKPKTGRGSIGKMKKKWSEYLTTQQKTSGVCGTYCRHSCKKFGIGTDTIKVRGAVRLLVNDRWYSDVVRKKNMCHASGSIVALSLHHFPLTDSCAIN